MLVALEIGVLGDGDPAQVAGEWIPVPAPSRAEVGLLDAGELFGRDLVADAITAFSEASTIK